MKVGIFPSGWHVQVYVRLLKHKWTLAATGCKNVLWLSLKLLNVFFALLLSSSHFSFDSPFKVFKIFYYSGLKPAEVSIQSSDCTLLHTPVTWSLCSRNRAALLPIRQEIVFCPEVGNFRAKGYHDGPRKKNTLQERNCLFHNRWLFSQFDVWPGMAHSVPQNTRVSCVVLLSVCRQNTRVVVLLSNNLWRHN